MISSIGTPKYLFNEFNINKYGVDENGVYGLYDDHGAVMYYGRSTANNSSCKERLKDHHSGSEGPCTQKAHYFNSSSVSNPDKAESELLEFFKSTHSKLPKCNDVMP